MNKIFRIICLSLLVFMVFFSVSCEKKPGTGELIVWVYDSGRIGALTEIGKKLYAEYKIPVEVSMVEISDIRTQFLLTSGGSECADLAILPHDNMGALIKDGAVAEMNIGSKRGAFLEPALESFTFNGKLYGIPLAVENIGFFYNPDLTPVPPETWAEAVTVSQALKREGKIDYMFSCPDATYHMFPLYESFGGSIFGANEDGSINGKLVTIADAGFVAGLEFLANNVRNGLIPETIDWDSAHVLFESGKAPFVLAGPWALDRIRTSGIPYKIGKFPGAKAGESGKPFMGVQGIFVSSASPRKLLAQAFALEYIANEESMMALFLADGRPSAWKTIFETLGDEDTLNFNAAGESAIPMPSIPEMGYVWDAWASAANLAFSGERTPAAALQNAKAQIESLSNN